MNFFFFLVFSLKVHFLTLKCNSCCSRSVDDIDFYIGGVSEKPISGAIVGPTFACILGRFFHDIKYGDRYFYETQQPEGFSPGKRYNARHGDVIIIMREWGIIEGDSQQGQRWRRSKSQRCTDRDCKLLLITSCNIRTGFYTLL